MHTTFSMYLAALSLYKVDVRILHYNALILHNYHGRTLVKKSLIKALLPNAGTVKTQTTKPALTNVYNTWYCMYSKCV